MRDLIVICVVALGSAVANAATVYWDQIGISDDYATCSATGEVGSGMGLGWYADDDGFYACIGVSMFYEKNAFGRVVGITPGTSDGVILASKAFWVLAYANDVISESYVQSGQLFYDGSKGVGINERYGGTVNVSNGDTLYLAFVAPNQENDEELIYGWVQLEVEEEQLSLVTSALSTDNLYVGGGAVPEPSCGVLLLLGVSILSLRRRSCVKRRLQDPS